MCWIGLCEPSASVARCAPLPSPPGSSAVSSTSKSSLSVVILLTFALSAFLSYSRDCDKAGDERTYKVAIAKIEANEAATEKLRLQDWGVRDCARAWGLRHFGLSDVMLPDLIISHSVFSVKLSEPQSPCSFREVGDVNCGLRGQCAD